VGSEDASEFLEGRLDTVAEDGSRYTYMLVEVLGDVRDIEVCVALVGELLELGIE
jgi:hypothetical protein